MVHVFKRLLVKGIVSIVTHGWSIITILLLILYFSGYLLMLLFQEQSIVEHYTWWFFVTITTVGYGDFSPSSIGGQYTAILIMILGIGAVALLIGKIAEWVITMSEKQSNGSLNLKVSGHILVMGYREGRTDQLIKEILADLCDEKIRIVLCSHHLQSNPFNKERVKFVRGDLASKDVLERACCAEASKIIITGKDDDQTFFSAFAVRQINHHAHMVVFMNQQEHVSKITCLPADRPELNQTILPSATNLIVQEIQDPHSSHVLQHLMSNLQGATLYRMDIPQEIDKQWTFGDLFIKLRQEFNITVLAIKSEEIITNPPMDIHVSSGMALFYMGEQRLKSIDWQNF